MIRVVNLKNYTLNEGEVLMRVDRATPLGNPYPMKHEGQRGEVIAKYARWIRHEMNSPFSKTSDYLKEIKKIADEKDVALGCWCYPKLCHANVIKRVLEQI